MKIVRYALKELYRRRSRTLSNITGYIISVVLLISLINTIHISDLATSSILEGTGTHFIAYRSLCSDESCENILLDEDNEGFYSNNSESSLISKSYVEAAESFDSVADASPYLLFRYNLVDHEAVLGGFELNSGISLHTNSLSPSDVIAGKFITEIDNKSILLEHSYAISRSLGVEDKVDISGEIFTVVGIVEPGIRPAKADIYMEYSDAESVINKRLKIPLNDKMSMLLIESTDAFLHKTAMVDIKDLLGGDSIITSYGCYKPASSVLNINNKTLLLLSLFIYLFMLTMIYKTQSSVVVDRRFELGILSSIGWKKSQIISQYIFEAIIQSFIGWLIGGIISTLLILYIPQKLSLPGYDQIVPQSYLWAFLIIISGGIVGSFIPAFKAVKSDPALCLRNL